MVNTRRGNDKLSFKHLQNTDSEINGQESDPATNQNKNYGTYYCRELRSGFVFERKPRRAAQPLRYEEYDSSDSYKKIRKSHIYVRRRRRVRKRSTLREKIYEERDDSDDQSSESSDESSNEINFQVKRPTREHKIDEQSNTIALRKTRKQSTDKDTLKSPIKNFNATNTSNNSNNDNNGQKSDDEDDDVKDEPEDNENASDVENTDYTTKRILRKRKWESDDTYDEEPRYFFRPNRHKDLREYTIRKTEPKKSKRFETVLNDAANNFLRRRCSKIRRIESSSTSSEPELKTEQKISAKKTKSRNIQPVRSKAGGSSTSTVLPIEPERIDTNVNFATIGGLDDHVQCLKEMIILPILYPEVFRKYDVEAPRGVLFYGPPGTGKTMMAKAVANECNIGSRKVSFFMRKGADLLSKWIGESEKQLRLLFEQAAKLKPSIIFFDELDGLAPVRSSRQDQVHASIVSTLLALMDGMEARGDIIVIGATNRIDAIDPALRRPGRFDRELFFSLPVRREREEILKVHTAKWTEPLGDELLGKLSENTAGFCGSDLKSLCAEAVIQSLRRNYPQVYSSNHRLQIDASKVMVDECDFRKALSLIVPASRRIATNSSKKMPAFLTVFYKDAMEELKNMLNEIFPHAVQTELAKVKVCDRIQHAHLLISADSDEQGQTSYLAANLLYEMEHIHVFSIDLERLNRADSGNSIEACVQIFNEARLNVPSVIFVPEIDRFWQLVNDSLQTVFISQLAKLNTSLPILLLATSNVEFDKLPNALTVIFSNARKEVFQYKDPIEDQRREFFKQIFLKKCIELPQPKIEYSPSPLPIAPTPDPLPLNKEESEKLYKTEEASLTELRIFLREVCNKLIKNRHFADFVKPVDEEDAPDYNQVIENPMDLETMLLKVDYHCYNSAHEFLDDIQLIVHNALEYNPTRTDLDKKIRHQAHSLLDYTKALIKSEMDSDFEDLCVRIDQDRKKRKFNLANHLSSFYRTGYLTYSKKGSNQIPSDNEIIAQEDEHLNFETQNDEQSSDSLNHKNSETNGSNTASHDTNTDDTESLTLSQLKSNLKNSRAEKRRRKKNLRLRQKKLCELQNVEEEELIQINGCGNDGNEQCSNETNLVPENTITSVQIDMTELEQLLEECVQLSERFTIQLFVDLYNTLLEVARKYENEFNRMKLPSELKDEMNRFKSLITW